MVKIKLSNKTAYSIIAVVALVLLAFGISALTPGVAPNPGHVLDNIAPPSGCAANEYLRWNGIQWDCVGNSNVQTRVTGNCLGRVITAINQDGSVSCEDDDVGSGGTSYTLNPTVYSSNKINPSINLGIHKFCFLTESRNTDNNAQWGCEIIEASGSWTLNSYGTEQTCVARCVD